MMTTIITSNALHGDAEKITCEIMVVMMVISL